MLEYTRLNNVRSVGEDGVYCPKCRNYLIVVANGFFHGQLFYCPKENKVFAIQLKDITIKAGGEYLLQCKEEQEMLEVRRKITRDNYKFIKV